MAVYTKSGTGSAQTLPPLTFPVTGAAPVAEITIGGGAGNITLGTIITAGGAVSGTAPTITCPGFTGTTEIDGGGDLVVKAMNPNPVMAIPVNAPLGLGLTALALAFLGRKRIKTALGA